VPAAEATEDKMNFRVSYIGEPTQNKSGGSSEDILDRYFRTLEEAQAAPFPNHVLFAFIRSGCGYFSCKKGFTWQYHAEDVSMPQAQ
jgi:hypothetical protein